MPVDTNEVVVCVGPPGQPPLTNTRDTHMGKARVTEEAATAATETAHTPASQQDSCNEKRQRLAFGRQARGWKYCHSHVFR